MWIIVSNKLRPLLPDLILFSPKPNIPYPLSGKYAFLQSMACGMSQGKLRGYGVLNVGKG